MNDQTDEGGYPCAPGFARFTPFFMGGMHLSCNLSCCPSMMGRGTCQVL
jgi:hypothetical protein